MENNETRHCTSKCSIVEHECEEYRFGISLNGNQVSSTLAKVVVLLGDLLKEKRRNKAGDGADYAEDDEGSPLCLSWQWVFTIGGRVGVGAVVVGHGV